MPGSRLNAAAYLYLAPQLYMQEYSYLMQQCPHPSLEIDPSFAYSTHHSPTLPIIRLLNPSPPPTLPIIAYSTHHSPAQPIASAYSTHHSPTRPIIRLLYPSPPPTRPIIRLLYPSSPPTRVTRPIASAYSIYRQASLENKMQFALKEQLPCLLYVGALTDAFPLTIPSLRQRYSAIVYTDGMPQSQYYTHKTLDSEQKILEILKTEGGYSAMISDFTYDDSDGSYNCQLTDNCSLKYFFNMDNIDINKIPRELLVSIKALWIHGYELPVEEVKKLSESGEIVLYISPECMDDADKLTPYFKEVNIIPSICHWDSGFNIAQPFDESQYLFLSECDVPHVVLEDPSDDDEDEGEIPEDKDEV